MNNEIEAEPEQQKVPMRSCADWVLEVEPWPEPVDGNLLLQELAQVMRRFVVVPKWGEATLALWTLHTYAFLYRDVSTYLGIESPEKRCGKTTLLTVLSELVDRPVVASNISSSAFFRVIEETRPTLIIDEADTFLRGNDELRGILNSGYTRKTAFVVRVANTPFEIPNPKFQVPKGHGKAMAEDKAGPSLTSQRDIPTSGRTSPQSGEGVRKPAWSGPMLARFSSWCPKVMAAIGRLPETLADRCIVLRMQRKTARESCERLRELEAEMWRRKCARFVADHGHQIATARPMIPASLNDRAADIWEPLFVLADLAGGKWPELARQSAEALTGSAEESHPISTLLLDIQVIFVVNKMERIFSRLLVSRLNSYKDRPWMDLRQGRAVDELWLAQQLRPYGIRPRTIWIGDGAGKGYMKADFAEVFERYIPSGEVEALRAIKETTKGGNG